MRIVISALPNLSQHSCIGGAEETAGVEADKIGPASVLQIVNVAN